ncbi:MAG: hypothetical protein JKX94_07400 [Sneathiella sp.]|nr:hypothetical protein [Sneathiella sp.]
MDDRTDFPEDRFVVYENLVKSSFAFLVEGYGFEISNIERIGNSYIALKYLSNKVFVNLYYSSPRFELDFYIGRVGIEDKPDKDGFTSNDLLFLSDDARWIDYKLYSAHSYENLRKCLPMLAELLKVCGANCLKGESSVYEKALFEKKRNINQWGKEQELKQAKKAASEAWKNKDYNRFIEVFEPVANELSASEKKKLNYARKHL